MNHFYENLYPTSTRVRRKDYDDDFQDTIHYKKCNHFCKTGPTGPTGDDVIIGLSQKRLQTSSF